MLDQCEKQLCRSGREEKASEKKERSLCHGNLSLDSWCMADYDRVKGREARPLLLLQHPIDEEDQEPCDKACQCTHDGLPPVDCVVGRLFFLIFIAFTLFYVFIITLYRENVKRFGEVCEKFLIPEGDYLTVIRRAEVLP